MGKKNDAPQNTTTTAAAASTAAANSVEHKEIVSEPASPSAPGLRRRRTTGVVALRSEEHLSELRRESTESGVPLIVDFTATWCGPCKRIAPLFEELSSTRNAIFLKVDIDEHGDYAMAQGVASVPTFIALQGDHELGRVTGASVDALNSLVNRVAPQ
jgi:thioredoxin